MKTPTIANPARMSESTYNKFTVHLPYVTTHNPANCPFIPCECTRKPALVVTAGQISPTHPCSRNLRMIQLRMRSAVATRGLWIEDQHNNDIAKSAAPPKPRQDQEALLIRAFLRSQEGWSNCRHNSSGSVNGASPRTDETMLRTIAGSARRAFRRRVDWWAPRMTNL